MRRLLARCLLGPGILLLLTSPVATAQSLKGRLEILHQGERIGTERYEIVRTASEVHAQGEVEIQVDNQTIRQTARLLLSADFSPRQYEWKMEEPEKTWRRMEFSGSRGTIVYPLGAGKEDQQVFEFGTTRVAVLGLYHHFLLLVDLYDFSRGGPQTIRVFIPQLVQPGQATVELQAVETERLEGQEVVVRQLLITTEDNRVFLWITESGRFVRLRAPLEKVEVVGEGVDAAAAS